jgi:hypothetical protein
MFVHSQPKSRMGLITVAITLALVIAMSFPLPAQALVQKTDYKNCSPNVVNIRSFTTGVTKHYAPTGTLRATFNNFSSWDDDYTHLSLSATWWKVTTDGLLSDPGTYAYCTGV